ncbi:predicted protein [Naegleria gruberi]|uniref:Predicted protein n=1 Tax=Naegleria gruberi TaxID=5762 RepID=D2UYC1_NAEGR|nr:uncharacterized protein NAEGRDRAFT_61420 [Naegleria gruberi]EFC50450.1 predicted protein [Naegleria gruberi]|eukprot:XP_002683194.1 predicted protein [Naegleria gruberi strain NEG-M]
MQNQQQDDKMELSSSQQVEFIDKFMGSPVLSIIEDLYNIAQAFISDGYDHFQQTLLNHIISSNPNMTKDEAKEIDRMLDDAVERMFNMSIQSLNSQFDIFEQFVKTYCFNEPQIPTECQESFCKLVNQDIMELNNEASNTVEDEDILKLISEINQIQEQTNSSYSELCQGITQSRQLLLQRQEIDKHLLYYHENVQKIDFIHEKLRHFSIDLEETIKSLIEQGKKLHEQYVNTKQVYEQFFGLPAREADAKESYFLRK